jgi:cytochrome-b5 reductase
MNRPSKKSVDHVKVALKPGHGLLDWIRLSETNNNLTGQLNRPCSIDEIELMKHNSRNDCWILLNNCVYNVTAYLEYHPGGELEMMRAAGTDATRLFQSIHPWVNSESMLKSCLIGPFVGNRLNCLTLV